VVEPGNSAIEKMVEEKVSSAADPSTTTTTTPQDAMEGTAKVETEASTARNDSGSNSDNKKSAASGSSPTAESTVQSQVMPRKGHLEGGRDKSAYCIHKHARTYESVNAANPPHAPLASTSAIT
jgi:hypothetical protein